jgi:hypothetical protein
MVVRRMIAGREYVREAGYWYEADYLRRMWLEGLTLFTDDEWRALTEEEVA